MEGGVCFLEAICLSCFSYIRMKKFTMTFYLILYLQDYSTILLERYRKEPKHSVYPAAITLKIKSTDVRVFELLFFIELYVHIF